MQNKLNYIIVSLFISAGSIAYASIGEDSAKYIESLKAGSKQATPTLKDVVKDIKKAEPAPLAVDTAAASAKETPDTKKPLAFNEDTDKAPKAVAKKMFTTEDTVDKPSKPKMVVKEKQVKETKSDHVRTVVQSHVRHNVMNHAAVHHRIHHVARVNNNAVTTGLPAKAVSVGIQSIFELGGKKYAVLSFDGVAANYRDGQQTPCGELKILDLEHIRVGNHDLVF